MGAATDRNSLKFLPFRQYRLWGQSLLLGIAEWCGDVHNLVGFNDVFAMHRSLLWKAEPCWERFLVGCHWGHPLEGWGNLLQDSLLLWLSITIVVKKYGFFLRLITTQCVDPKWSTSGSYAYTYDHLMDIHTHTHVHLHMHIILMHIHIEIYIYKLFCLKMVQQNPSDDHQFLYVLQSPFWGPLNLSTSMYSKYSIYTNCGLWKAPLPILIPSSSQWLRYPHWSARIDSRFCGCHPFCLVVLASLGPRTCG